jgi:hypothetical protein
MSNENKGNILKENINAYGNEKGTLYPEPART